MKHAFLRALKWVLNLLAYLCKYVCRSKHTFDDSQRENNILGGRNNDDKCDHVSTDDHRTR